MIPPEKLEAYKRGARAREARRRREAAQRRELAWRVAGQAARLLKEQFGAVRVVVFGSLAHGAWFHLDSDIDLAVAGIAPELFWRAWCALDQVSAGFEINLVALEAAPKACPTAFSDELLLSSRRVGRAVEDFGDLPLGIFGQRGHGVRRQ